MKKYNNLYELIQAKAKQNHSNNLEHGGVAVDTVEAAEKEGLDYKKGDDGLIRVSDYDNEWSIAESKIKWVSGKYAITAGLSVQDTSVNYKYIPHIGYCISK